MLLHSLGRRKSARNNAPVLSFTLAPGNKPVGIISMHYAFLTSIVIAALLGAAAMSVVHAEEGSDPSPAEQAQTDTASAEAVIPTLEARPVEISTSPAEAIERPARESYYGQGFESRGISVEKRPADRRAYGYERSE